MKQMLSENNVALNYSFNVRDMYLICKITIVYYIY